MDFTILSRVDDIAISVTGISEVDQRTIVTHPEDDITISITRPE